jgi:TetR/AcrR family transcriptional regulator
MLETRPGTRITTAALAAQVGVSEAALYRHFPSKAKMIDGLIEFIEDSLFPRIRRLQSEDLSIEERCGALLLLLLTFAERNPGFARLLVGDALQGETERLRVRVRQLFDRLETELRQMLRTWGGGQVPGPRYTASVAANLMLAAAEGRINQFVRSEFKALPTTSWDQQWGALASVLFTLGAASADSG